MPTPTQTPRILRATNAIAVAGLAVIVAGCASASAGATRSSASAGSPTAAATSTASTASTASTTSSATTSAPPVRSRHLPIAVQTDAAMRAAGNMGPSSTAILAAASCTIAGRNVTATGTFRGGSVPEVYLRYGDVIVLYVFTAPATGYRTGVQVARLSGGRFPGLSGGGPWRAGVTDVASLGTPRRCLVAAQPTHDFEGAPSAY